MGRNKSKKKKAVQFLGIVRKSTGKWYSVRLEDGTDIACRIKGKFRLDKVKLTNPVAVGDKVLVEKEEGLETGTIVHILPRENYVLRQSTRKRHFMHLIASNIDQAIVVVTLKMPMIKPNFIDRFLLTTATHDIPSCIIVNKADIYDEEDLQMYHGVKHIYEQIGYKVLLVSAEKRENIEEVKELLKGKVSLLSGHSGVGKSSLVNAIEPNLDLRTNYVSDYSEKGMHTTTFAEMFELSFDAKIIDTPGIKELGFINMEPMDVAHNFKEIFHYSKVCKFNDCLHINEPNCAVKDAVEQGEISILRYQNYLSIIDEINDQNYWERRTDW